MGKERVETVVERLGNQVAAGLNYELVDVEYRKEGPDWVLRCFIDKENGVGIEDCQRFSEALDEVLDETDPIPGKYLLEVSSPGIERPLKKEGDFIKFAGKTIEIKLNKALNNRKTYRGELIGMVGDEAERKVALKIDESNVVEVPWDKIAKANLLMETFGGGEGGKKRR